MYLMSQCSECGDARPGFNSQKARSNSRKKAAEGIFIGYSKQPLGWRILVPTLEKTLTSVFVTFDETVHIPSDTQYQSLLKIIPVDSTERPAEDFEKYIGTHHIDDEDGMPYVVTRIGIRKGIIVAWRGLVPTEHQSVIESRVPIHVADIVRMTEATDARMLEAEVPRLADDPKEMADVTCGKTSPLLLPELTVATQRSGAKYNLRSVLLTYRDEQQLMSEVAPRTYAQAIRAPDAEEWRESMQLEIE